MHSKAVLSRHRKCNPPEYPTDLVDRATIRAWVAEISDRFFKRPCVLDAYGQPCTSEQYCARHEKESAVVDRLIMWRISAMRRLASAERSAV